MGRSEHLGDFVTVVAGLPRSGTSMMMRMLEAGGLSVLTDHVRTADADNPEGYYEYERVKQIEEDQAWLGQARGRVVKMVSALLEHLPPPFDAVGRGKLHATVMGYGAYSRLSGGMLPEEGRCLWPR